MNPYSASVAMTKVTALRPYAANARTHSKKQIQQIADSIRRFGFTNPVLIGDDDEILAGHGRVLAAKHLGLGDVPTIKLSISLRKSDVPMFSPTTSSPSTPAGIPRSWQSSCRACWMSISM